MVILMFPAGSSSDTGVLAAVDAMVESGTGRAVVLREEISPMRWTASWRATSERTTSTGSSIVSMSRRRGRDSTEDLERDIWVDWRPVRVVRPTIESPHDVAPFCGLSGDTERASRTKQKFEELS
jgi:hypothetical protein